MMKLCLVATLALMTATGSVLAFEPATQDVVARAKAGKTLPMSMVSVLMAESERWCYREANGSCDWSDVYLSVDDGGAVQFEVGNAWSAEVDIVMTDLGQIVGNTICETGYDWVPTVRATRRSDGSPIGGRELQAIKDEISVNREGSVIDCFDYLFQSADAAAQTVTLLQRQYIEGEHQPANDVVVTLHFDPATAASLSWRFEAVDGGPA